MAEIAGGWWESLIHPNLAAEAERGSKEPQSRAS